MLSLFECNSGGIELPLCKSNIMKFGKTRLLQGIKWFGVWAYMGLAI